MYIILFQFLLQVDLTIRKPENTHYLIIQVYFTFIVNITIISVTISHQNICKTTNLLLK